MYICNSVYFLALNSKGIFVSGRKAYIKLKLIEWMNSLDCNSNIICLLSNIIQLFMTLLFSVYIAKKHFSCVLLERR